MEIYGPMCGRYTVFFDGFTFFGWAPRTGREWFLRACREAGLKPLLSGHRPRQLTVSVVRHPCGWLASYYRAACPSRPNFENYVRKVLRHGGVWHTQFMPSRADSYLRLEDFPHCVIELLEMYGGDTHTLRSLPKLGVNPHPAFEFSPQLRADVMNTDHEMCQRFVYGSHTAL